MRESTGELWEFYDAEPDAWVAITTNGAVKQDGCLVMGAGCALGAQKRFPQLPRLWGEMVNRAGNHVSPWPSFRLFTFPVKTHWREYATLELIERSAHELMENIDLVGCGKVFLPRPGCGNGGLNWSDVRPVISAVLDDRVVTVTWKVPERISS
jgi:hypothetical protein